MTKKPRKSSVACGLYPSAKRRIYKNPFIGVSDQPGERPRNFGRVLAILENVKILPLFLNRGGNFEETYLFKIEHPTLINVKKPFVLRPGRYILKYGQEQCSDPEVDNNLKFLITAIQKELQKWHDYKIVHGDIAVRNIMIEKNGRIWLIDPLLDSCEIDRKNYDANIIEDQKDLDKVVRQITDEW